MIALVSLLAPYELLTDARWMRYLDPFFLLAAAVSIGVLAVSSLFFFAAVAGPAASAVFNRAHASVTHSSRAPRVRDRAQIVRFSEIEGFLIGTHEWSDGPPSYSLLLCANGGTPLRPDSSWTCSELEDVEDRIEVWLTPTGRRRRTSAGGWVIQTTARSSIAALRFTGISTCAT